MAASRKTASRDLDHRRHPRHTGRSSRYLNARDIPVASQICLNTVQGRWWVADSRGAVCQRSSLDTASGCCRSGDKNSCATCNPEDQCCENYEHCVACCQDPKNAPADLTTAYRGPDRPETGTWADVFAYCQDRCRTSSKSTVHENAYLSPSHHCYSKSGKPMTPAPPTPEVPTFISVVQGSAGQSCTALCQGVGRRCAQEHLAALNNCNILRQHFPCEAGCEPEPSATDAPAYVEASAPKQQRPTMCLTQDEKALSFSCDAAQANQQRLCACEENTIRL
ncbi:g9775 [Coccomyxa viridis]|uniref:SREBP regulating gene protein n=1 Tax=Coccomyxa viridis TaxID=1274662 RepID=A0ABP1G448_9CHLO